MQAFVREVLDSVESVQHGFQKIKLEAGKLGKRLQSPESIYEAAQELYDCKTYQVRMTAVFMLGGIAQAKPEAFAFLRETVSEDKAWQVQEILAQAFDEFCRANGYKESLVIIKSWLSDVRPYVRRAASEGLRIWNARPYFKEHPETALSLLAELRADKSEYVRRSAGNAIRDISRTQSELVREELGKWNLSNAHIRQTYELAARFLNK